MDNADDDTCVMQVERQQLADHIQSRLGGVVGIVAATLGDMAQSDRAGFGRNEKDFGAGREELCVVQRMNYKRWGDGGCC